MSFTCDVLPEFYETSEPVAQKAHRCCECSAPILAGERYFCGRGKWEGPVETYRQHLLCMTACILIRDRFEAGECIPFGCLWEWWAEARPGYDRQRDREKEEWQQLRQLLAEIRRRERRHREGVGA